MRQRLRGNRDKGQYLYLDRPRRVLYTVDSLEILWIKTGVQIKDLMKLHTSWVPTLIWAGLIWEDPGLKIKEVEEMVEAKTQGNETAIAKLFLAVSPAIINYDRDQKFREDVFRRRGE